MNGHMGHLTADGTCTCGDYCRAAERWEQQAEIVRAMTRDGYSGAAIAARLHITRRTVVRMRGRLGISRKEAA